MENEEKQRPEDLRLNLEQRAEIGDILLSARAISRQMVNQAREQSDEILQLAHDRAEQIEQGAEEKAEAIVREAEEKAAAIIREAEEKAVGLIEEASQPRDVMSAQMQEYVVQCVGDCFSKLRQQQLETVDYINEQWRGFLSGLSLSDEVQGPTRDQQPPKSDEISRQDIEARVSAIAKELMEIIGN